MKDTQPQLFEDFSGVFDGPKIIPINKIDKNKSAQIEWQYVLCITTVHLVSKILRYRSLIVHLSNFAGRH